MITLRASGSRNDTSGGSAMETEIGNPRRLPGSDIVAVYAPPVALMAVLRNDHPEGLRKPERHEWRERHGNRDREPAPAPRLGHRCCIRTSCCANGRPA